MKSGFLPVLALSAAAFVAASGATPEIRLTFLPPTGSSADLSGEVRGAAPATHRVAVYLFVEGWWNKPSFEEPLTTIRPDGSWTCDITTGGADAWGPKVAVFLVPDSYTPPLLVNAPVLPPELAANSLASVHARRPSPMAFHWCGYDWDVKSSGTFPFGPGPNIFSDDPRNVWVDGDGRLHLRLTHRNGSWQCAEVVSRRSFGFGTYRFFLDSPADALDPMVVLGLFTYDHDPTDTGGHREIDVEMSRWGVASDPANAQFVVQPFLGEDDRARWTLPTGANPTTHSFTWSPGRVDFASHDGLFAPPPAAVPQIASWSRTGPTVPTPGPGQVRMNLWLMNGQAPADGKEVEVVVSRFAFIPPEPSAPRITGGTLDPDGTILLDLRGEPQLWYRLESSPDLIRWTPLPPFIAPETTFQQSAPAATPRHFYRTAVVPEQ